MHLLFLALFVVVLTASTAFAQQPPAAPVPNGLTNWYRAENNALDTQSGANGVINNVGFGAGKVGTGFAFNGGGNIALPNSVGNFGTNAFSVDFWFNTTQTEILGTPIALLGNRVGCSDGNFFGVRMFSSNSLLVELDENGANYNAVQVSSGLNNALWHHVAIVRQGTTLTVYLDGAVAGANSTTAITNITGANPFLLGADGCGLTQPYVGGLDELHIYNTALTATQVQGIHTAGISGLTTLVGLWNFNEGTGTTTIDTSRNGNDGTLSGTTLPAWTTDVPTGTFHPFSLSFDGNTSYVNVANGATASALNFTGQVTMAAWVKMGAPTGPQGIFGIISKPSTAHETGWRMAIGFNNALDFGLSNGIINCAVDATSNPLTPGLWTHVLASYDSTTATVQLFINGVSVPAITQGQACSGQLPISAIPLQIGEEYVGGGRNFNGEISEARVYNRLLTGTEISQLANPPASDITTCGTVITSPGAYVLFNDLTNCPGNGVDIQTSNVLLKLAGHTISGQNLNNTNGITVGGPAVGVSNVTVAGPGVVSSFSQGVCTDGASNSLITGLSITGNGQGVCINQTFQAGNLRSTNNHFINNNVSGNSFHGFTFNGGDQNFLTGNVATKNGQSGVFLFDAHGNNVLNNIVSGNGGQGIIAQSSGGTGNLIQNNTALGNASNDLEDDNPECANTWTANVFGTANQACVSSRAVLTVTATSFTKLYGAPVPTLTYTVTGFLNGNTASILSGAPVLTTNATQSSGVGTYTIAISPGNLSASNYIFNFVNGTLSVYSGPVASPAGAAEFLYANNQGSSNSISGYVIDSATGALTAIAGSPFPVLSTGTNDLTVDPFSRFVFAANVSGSAVSGFTINPTDGSLAQIPGSPFAFFGFSGASQVAEDPSGQFLYIGQPTQLFRVGLDQQMGSLALPNTAPFGLPTPNPQKFAIHPSGRFLYLPDWANGLGNTVSGYAIDPTSGMLTSLPGSPYLTDPGPFAVSIDPLGRFAFVTQASGTLISVFDIDAGTGVLTPLPGSPFSVLQQVSGSQQGSVLLFDGFNIAGVTQQNGGPPIPTTFALTALTQVTQLATYHYNGGAGATPGTISLRDQNGNVYGPFPAQGINAQSQPQPPFVNWVATLSNVILPAGTYTVVDSDPSTWSYNTQSNNRGFVRVWGFATGARGIAIDPRGQFLFVGDSSNNLTWGFTIDQATGALQAVSGSPYPNGGAAEVVDATGNFLYTACGSTCGIASFRINQTTGALTAVGTSVNSGAIVRLATASSTRSTTITATASPNPVHYGQATTIAATILSNGVLVPGGTVRFFDDLTSAAYGSATVANGVASLNIATLSVGTHVIIAAYTGSGTSTVFASSATKLVVNVSPAVLTVMPNDQTKSYGDVLPALTASFIGLVNGDTVASAVTGAPALSTVVTPITPAGNYPIFAAQGTLASANYTFVLALGTLTVTPAASVSLPASSPSTITGGGTDTYATPYAVPQDGFITAWQTEFTGAIFSTSTPGVPTGVQLKILRNTSSGLQVVAQGVVHDPRSLLQQRFPGGVAIDQQSLTTFNEAPIPVMAGDLVGITISAPPLVGYLYPLIGPSGTLVVSRNVLLGQSINPADPSTRSIVSPPALSFTLSPASTSNPLNLMNNFFVTGDYASASVTLRGTGVGGVATGTITMPTSNQNLANGIPDGADIVGAFLYWETLEPTPSPSANSGTFDGYSISGQKIGNDLQYREGDFTGTMRVYRADVLPYLALSNGVRVGSGSHTVSFPDSGFTGLPLTEGASLVVIYRVISPNFPLKAVVLYDGSAAPTNSGMLQIIQGFYDAAGLNGTPLAKTTNIYTNVDGFSSSTTTVSPVSGSEYATTLTRGAWAAVVFSTPVNNSDNDGILDAWKSGPPAPDFHAGQSGYYDVKNQQWISLPGAAQGQKDLFVQLDYMCDSVLSDGTCDPTKRSELPVTDPQGHDPLLLLQQVFANRGIALHLQIGNAIQAETCTDNLTVNPPQLCQFPNQSGVLNWKLGQEIFKVWPRNPAGCASGGDCSPRFPYGAKDSYHYLLMADSLAIPAWNTTWGTLTGITVANGITTITTTDRGSGINACPSRITIAGALGNPSLNGVYNTTGCTDTSTITIATPNVPNWSYPNNTLPEPVLGVTSGTVSSISGFSDLGGSDSVVSLGKWETSPNQDMSKRVNVQTGTLLHEIGHTLGLAHGGTYYDVAGSARRTFEANCKPNYQSIMNYEFQLDGLGPNHALDFSSQTLTPLNESFVGTTTQLVNLSGAPANYPTSAWYVPWTSGSGATPATRHCDGSPLNGGLAYRVDAPISPVNPAWINGQDINFDGQLNTSMRGYNDWANIDLRQVGATSGQFVPIANLLQFGNIGSPLNVGAGGNVTLGSGGTVALGSGGTVTLGSGGSATLSNGGTITLGSGGTVTLGSGGTVTLGSGGTITMGSGGNVILGSAGAFALGSSGGTITLGSGGNVTLGSGGTVTLGSGGTILLGSGGTVVLGAGGSYTLDGSGGTITLGSGGNVTLGSGGNVTLGSGGTIALGSGGNITLGSGGTVALGSGGTVTLGSGGNVTLGSGGTVTLGSGGTVTMGSGGNVTLGSGGNVTLGSGGTVTLGGGGNVALGSGGNVTLGSGGTVALGSGGNVTLGSGGNVTLGSGGTIALGSGGTVTLGSGGNVTLGSGGTVALGSGGNITLGSGGTVTLGSGGLVTLGSGGTVTLGSGGSLSVPAGGSYTGSSGDVISVGAGGNIALGSGGTIALGSGGNITLGSGGTITMGSGGNVTLGSGGNVTLGSGGTITMGSGGTVTLGSGGNVTLGSGGNVTLGSGGNIALGSGGNVTLGSGGTVALGSGGNTILGSGGNITLGSGGNIALGSGGTVTLGAGGTFAFGSGGNVTLGSGGNIALGSGGNIALGSGGNIALGSGGTTVGSEGGVTLGSGGATTLDEITYETANSVVRPPDAPTLAKVPTPNGSVVAVNWTPPAFGVVTSYTIFRSENGGTPVAIGTVSGNPPTTTFIDTNPSGAPTVAYTISTGVTDPGTATRQSPPSVPALLAQTITFGPLPNAKMGDTVPVSATASSGLTVNFSTVGNCALAGPLTSPSSVQATTVGACTVTASQAGDPKYAAAMSVAQTFSIAPASPTKNNQFITFPGLATHTYGDPDFTLLAMASSNLPVSYMASGNCSVSGSTLHITGAGSCSVTASQAGNNDYNAAPNVMQSFTIGRASAKISVVGYNVTYDAHAHSATGTATGVVGENLGSSLSLSATTHTAAGTYPGDAWTFTDTTGNYNSASGTVSDRITQATASVTPAAASKIYGAADPVFAGTLIGFAASDGVTATYSRTAGEKVAGSPYTITATLGPVAVLGNYNITYNTATFTITQATLTVTADNKSKILNAANPSFTATYTGFKNGDTLATSVTGTPSLTTTATTTSPVGVYTILAAVGSLASSNYTFAFANGTLTIVYASAGACDGATGHTILPPVNSDGTSVWKQGRTIPVQFRVCDSKGISIGTPGVVTSFMLTGIYNGTVTSVEQTVAATNNDTAFRWDSSGQQWIFNLSTSSLSAGKTYIYTIQLNDGTIVSGVTFAPAGTASFQFGLR